MLPNFQLVPKLLSSVNLLTHPKNCQLHNFAKLHKLQAARKSLLQNNMSCLFTFLVVLLQSLVLLLLLLYCNAILYLQAFMNVVGTITGTNFNDKQLTHHFVPNKVSNYCPAEFTKLQPSQAVPYFTKLLALFCLTF